MPGRELAPTRIALLELGEERATAREGYALLDEKRMMLAARMLALLAEHAEACRDWRTGLAAAEAALGAALDRHGLRDVELRPRGVTAVAFTVREQRLLGIHVPDVEVKSVAPPPPVPAVDDSPEAHAAADTFRALLAHAPAIAALECALWRLADEYRRTERRAGAIEHLLLPEIERDIEQISTALEAADREESLRVRLARHGA